MRNYNFISFFNVNTGSFKLFDLGRRGQVAYFVYGAWMDRRVGGRINGWVGGGWLGGWVDGLLGGWVAHPKYIASNSATNR